MNKIVISAKRRALWVKCEEGSVVSAGIVDPIVLPTPEPAKPSEGGNLPPTKTTTSL